MSPIRSRLFASGFMATLLFLASPSRAATPYQINYLDEGTSSGFEDPTVVAPVGGNTGTTRGAQRRIAFEFAVEVWTSVVSSDVPIAIDATMTSLECDEYAAVLGQAAPTTALALTLDEAPGFGQTLYYMVGLGNALAGEDLWTDEVARAEGYDSGAEITAEFNADLDEPDCLGDVSWYLGLDGNPGDNSDFVGVVLHELGHGFGFSTLIDPTTGAGLSDVPDVVSTMVLDLDQNSTWSAMDSDTLMASLQNARRVVWTGKNVTATASRFLVTGTPRITAVPAVSGLSGMVSEQEVGLKPADHPVTAPLVVASPRTGCSEPENAGALQGAIALVEPGDTCQGLDAAVTMELAGAAATIIVDSTGTLPPPPVLGELLGQTIPIVSVSASDGSLLAAAAGAAITIDGNASHLLGADTNGRLYLYTTSPIEPGSTGAHWDSSARPNLLMEPTATSAHLDVDITRQFMQDIGWPICGDSILQAAEECDDGNAQDLDGCSASCVAEICGDGLVNDSPHETCDDGNLTSGDGCSSTCQLESPCGNGKLDSGETCDDGNTISGDGCSSTCQSETSGAGGAGGAGAGGGASSGPAGNAGDPNGPGSDTGDEAQGSTSGCSCRVAGNPGPSGSGWAALGLLLGAATTFRPSGHRLAKRAQRLGLLGRPRRSHP
jgi:MYXO-CTERM domain-containing protein